MAKPDEKELSIEERLLRIQERQLAIQERQADQQAAAVKVQQAQLDQTKKRSLLQGPKISVFNPRGEKDFPMPRLKCEVHCPWSNTPEVHGFDREEVELVNLLEPGEYQIELTDGATVTAFIVGDTNTVTGHIERLTFCGAYDPAQRMYAALFTKERKQAFPAFRIMLRQMLGDKADAVVTMGEERRRIALPAEDPKHLAVSVAEA